MQIVAPPKKRRPGARRQKRSVRGVALIFVLTTIAILTAIGVDFSYQSRVNFELAIQSRDALRARSIAMSGMNMARLLLHFQGQVDQATAAAGQQINKVVNAMLAFLPGYDTKPLTDLCTVAGFNPQNCLKAISAQPERQGNTPAPGGGLSIQLWKATEKFDSTTIFNFLNAFPMSAEKRGAVSQPSFGVDASGAAPIEASFGEFSGTFDVKVTDEDQKINVSRLYGSDVAGISLSAVLQLKPLLENPTYDFLFQKEDKNREKVPRNDVITAMRDWIDADETQTPLDPTIVTGNPFPAAGAGDENGNYSRYKPRYRAKNANFDSVDELRMVYGVNDDFMATFGDKLTVYPDPKSKLNVNTADLEQLWSDAYAMAANPRDPLLQNPMLPRILMLEVQYRKHMLPFIGISAPDFMAMLEANGIAVNPQLKNPNSPQSVWGGSSSTFRIVSTGYAGRVKKTLTAVVRYDAGMGQLLYWHEE